MKLLRVIGVLAAVALSALVLGACGGDDEEPAIGTGASAGTTTGNEIDRAFAAGMIPHHESAIEMAEIAIEQGESDFVKQLAEDIISAQEREIETLTRIDGQLESEGVEAGDLGAGHMGSTDTAMLRDADPFDRAFVDMMVPHHQSAIDMAEVELEQGENPELKTLAQEIIDAQQREIDEMNEFREKEYGAPVPGDGMEDMDHGG